MVLEALVVQYFKIVSFNLINNLHGNFQFICRVNILKSIKFGVDIHCGHIDILLALKREFGSNRFCRYKFQVGLFWKPLFLNFDF